MRLSRRALVIGAGTVGLAVSVPLRRGWGQPETKEYRLAAKPADRLEQPRVAEFVASPVERIGHAVGVRDDDVARRHREDAVRERRRVEHADYAPAGRQPLKAVGRYE